jgi:hypothetical protein
MFDIDNRAAQETGYLFEPIIASAIGGVPTSSTKSPVRRRGNRAQGRQVDCIRDTSAYEIKLRVTIAASGQGRWQEELDFPADCRVSGFKPILLVLDPTDNPKLRELVRTFTATATFGPTAGSFVGDDGEAYVGDAAWTHLEGRAGATMSLFIEKYVRGPIQALLNSSPETRQLPALSLEMSSSQLTVNVAGETLEVPRALPPDADTSVGDIVQSDKLDVDLESEL